MSKRLPLGRGGSRGGSAVCGRMLVVSCAAAVAALAPSVAAQLLDGGTVIGPGTPVQVVHATDLDGDGDGDLVFGDGQLRWMENLGGASFSAPATITIAISDPTQVDSADVDGDGDPDVLAAWPSQSIVSWHRNDVPVFGGIDLVTAASAAASRFALGDLDSDGDVDVILPVASGLAWFENDGGAFPGQQPISASSAAWPAVGDVDGDGIVDVLAAAPEAFWCKNDGSGNFAPDATISTLPNIWSVHAADLDADGDDDPLIGFENIAPIPLAWYELQPGQFFTVREVIDSQSLFGCYSRGVTADLDNDGDLDVIAGFSCAPVRWYENIVLTVFGSPQPLGTVKPNDVSVFDVDADTDSDIVAATQTGVRLYENMLSGANPWSVVGEPLAGTTTPHLAGHGSQVPGTVTTIKLSEAPPSALTFLVLGFSAYNVSFKGGVLVPKDDFVITDVASSTGIIQFSFPWPAIIPPTFETYWQYWIPDGSGPVGFASTNGLMGLSQ